MDKIDLINEIKCLAKIYQSALRFIPQELDDIANDAEYCHGRMDAYTSIIRLLEANIIEE